MSTQKRLFFWFLLLFMWFYVVFKMFKNFVYARSCFRIHIKHLPILQIKNLLKPIGFHLRLFIYIWLLILSLRMCFYKRKEQRAHYRKGKSQYFHIVVNFHIFADCPNDTKLNIYNKNTK